MKKPTDLDLHCYFIKYVNFYQKPGSSNLTGFYEIRSGHGILIYSAWRGLTLTVRSALWFLNLVVQYRRHINEFLNTVIKQILELFYKLKVKALKRNPFSRIVLLNTQSYHLHIHLLNVVVRFIVFLTSATLICRGTDISKCFRETLGIRDNESRLYFVIKYCNKGCETFGNNSCDPSKQVV